MSYAANALSRTSWMRLRNELPKLLGTIQNFHEKNTGPTTGAVTWGWLNRSVWV